MTRLSDADLTAIEERAGRYRDPLEYGGAAVLAREDVPRLVAEIRRRREALDDLILPLDNLRQLEEASGARYPSMLLADTVAQIQAALAAEGTGESER